MSVQESEIGARSIAAVTGASGSAERWAEPSVVEQTTRLMTGNTLLRLQTEGVEKLLVPIPSEAEQEKIISGVQSSYSKMRNPACACGRNFGEHLKTSRTDLGLSGPETLVRFTDLC
jgi:hypothetical protein